MGNNVMPTCGFAELSQAFIAKDNWFKILIALLIMSVIRNHMALEFINNAEACEH